MKYSHKITLLFFLFISINNHAIANTSAQNNKKLTIAFQKLPYTLNFIKEFNHTELHIHSAIYSGLLSPSPSSLTPKVGLAISWFVNKNNTVYTFNLRKNIHFANGKIITAQDVKDSWLTAIKAKNAFLYLYEMIKGVPEYISGKGNIEDIKLEIVNDKVLKVILREPAPYFLQTITHPAFSVSSSKQMQVDNWDMHPLEIDFTGPYIITQQRDQSLTLTKNKFYWDKDSVHFEEVEILFYTKNEENTLITDINSGKVQWSTFYINDKDTHTLDNEEWLKIHPIFGSKYLFFGDTVTEPWNNANIRTAIKLFLPLDTILPEKYTFPASGFVPPIKENYEPGLTIPIQNTKKAYNLLDMEGFPKGKGLGKIVLLAPAYQNKEYDTIFDIIKNTLGEFLETSIVIKTLPSSEYYDNLSNENFTIGITSWIGDFADPNAFLQLWSTPNAALGHNYNNQEYQKLLSLSHLQKGDMRIQTQIAAEKMLLETTVIIPLHQLYGLNVIRDDLIKGWYSNILDLHPIGAMYKPHLGTIKHFTLLSR